MIQLTPEQHEALRLIVATGEAGLVLSGRDVRLSTAIQLETLGFITLTKGQRIVATATSTGRAFLHRVAA